MLTHSPLTTAPWDAHCYHPNSHLTRVAQGAQGCAEGTPGFEPGLSGGSTLHTPALPRRRGPSSGRADKDAGLILHAPHAPVQPTSCLYLQNASGIQPLLTSSSANPLRQATISVISTGFPGSVLASPTPPPISLVLLQLPLKEGAFTHLIRMMLYNRLWLPSLSEENPVSL